MSPLVLLYLTVLSAPEPNQPAQAGGAPASPEASVQTSRTGRPLSLPKGEDVFHFVVFGDRTGGPRTGIRVLEQAVKDTNLLDPDLVMTVGDLIEGYNQTELWMQEMKEYQTIMGGLKAPWFPVAGNHDVYWRGGPAPKGHHESSYETHFGPLWYYFTHKDAAFVVLYSDEGNRETNEKGWKEGLNRMSDEQLAWLKTALEKTESLDHVFVFLHHPRWITDYYPGSNWEAVHTLLKAAGNVTAVFAGHIHRRRYDGKRDGIEYLTLGTTGGAIPYSSAPTTGWMHHFDVVTVRKDRISMASLPVGKVLDPRVMRPERLGKIEGLLFSGLDLKNARPKVDAVGRGFGRAEIVYKNPLDTPVRITAEFDADDPQWSFRPDHVHRTAKPGESIRLGFAYRREPGLSDLASVEFNALLEAEIGGILVRSPSIRRVLDPAMGPKPRMSKGETAGCLETGSPEGEFGEMGALRIASEEVPLPDGPFTLEAWVRPNSLKGPQTIASKIEWSEYGLYLREGKPLLAVVFKGGYKLARSSKLLSNDRFTHVAGVFDGKELRLYQDGALLAQEKGSGERARNELPFLIGADPDREGLPKESFQGQLDAVRLSKVARYAGEKIAPAQTFEPDPDTVFLFEFGAKTGPYIFGETKQRTTGYITGAARRRPVCEGR